MTETLEDLGFQEALDAYDDAFMKWEEQHEGMLPVGVLQECLEPAILAYLKPHKVAQTKREAELESAIDVLGELRDSYEESEAKLVKALEALVERIDINGGLGQYKSGKPFALREARQLVSNYKQQEKE